MIMVQALLVLWLVVALAFAALATADNQRGAAWWCLTFSALCALALKLTL